ncbi:MAG: hypothetical protein LBH81_02040 [Rickettsiales bacterium]|jgi:hypothetical protein|nr:hypothetical protein [Rickettsiales bacterium]
MLNLLKNLLIVALVVMSALWAWDKFGVLLFKKTGGLTPESNLAEWNKGNATERELVVRTVLVEPARVSRLTDCITIMATVSESEKMVVRDAIPLCMTGTFAADQIRVLIKSEQ